MMVSITLPPKPADGADATPRRSTIEDLLPHQRTAYALALRMLGNAADAEDALQQAYLQALAFQKPRPGGEEGKRWFLAVVANAARRHRNRQRRRDERFLGPIPQDQPAPEALEEASSEHRQLIAAVGSLESKFRTAIAMRYEMGLSYDQAADILRMPAARVRLHVSRGIAKLRDALARNGSPIGEELIAGALAAMPMLPVPPASQAAIAQIASGHPPAHLLAPPPSSLGAGTLLAVAATVLTIASVLVGQAAHPSSAPAGPHQVALAAREATPPLQAFLATSAAYRYRHDSVLSLITDLQLRAGLTGGIAVRAPLPLASLGPIDASGQGSVADILALVERLGLAVDARPDAVVVWRQADLSDVATWKRALVDGDPTRRSIALIALAESGDRAAPAAISQALDDPDPAVADLALDSLARYADVLPWIDDRARVAAALARARAEPGWRTHALEACLRGLVDLPGVAGLLRHLGSTFAADADPRTPWARAPAHLALAAQLDADAIAAALGAGDHAADYAAIARLDDLGRDLRGCLCEPDLNATRGIDVDAGDAAVDVDQLASTAEDRLAWPVALCASLGMPSASSALRAAARDAEPTVRARAALGMGESRSAAFTDDLADLAERDPELVVRQQAVWALGELRERERVDPILLRLMGDPAISVLAELAHARQHPGQIELITYAVRTQGAPQGTVVETATTDGDIAASDVARASARCRGYVLSTLTALPALHAFESTSHSGVGALTGEDAELAQLLSHDGLVARGARIASLAAPGRPALAALRFARPVAGALPAEISVQQADGHRLDVRICPRGGLVRAAIVDCYGSLGRLDAAYLATAWRGEDGAIAVDARRAAVAGALCLAWSPDSLRIDATAGAQSCDDDGLVQACRPVDAHAPLPSDR